MFSQALTVSSQALKDAKGFTVPKHRQFSVRPMAMKFNVDPKNKKARPQNVPGSFYVDHSCIDCDMCRRMAPEVFRQVDGQSAVIAQPDTKDGRIQALQAMVSCPTFSIHTKERNPSEMKLAIEGMPIPVEGCPGVYHTGFASKESLAGTTYFIARPGGNILVDCPRAHPDLIRRIKELGGVKYMFLTHRDDVGLHWQWKEHFPDLQRVIHKLEANEHQRTTECEIQLEGEGPWMCGPPGSDDALILFTPGHTEGCISLLFRPAQALFTGDHLAADLENPDLGLGISRYFNFYSVPVQLQSIQKLLEYDFLHVLPAHGWRVHLRDAFDRMRQISDLLTREGHVQPVSAQPERTIVNNVSPLN